MAYLTTLSGLGTDPAVTDNILSFLDENPELDPDFSHAVSKSTDGFVINTAELVVKGFTTVHATGRYGQRMSIFYIRKKRRKFYMWWRTQDFNIVDEGIRTEECPTGRIHPRAVSP
jgi:hypothetical protein